MAIFIDASLSWAKMSLAKAVLSFVVLSLAGLMGALSIEKHKLLTGKAITSPSSSNDLPLRDNAEEGSSLSGISWADLFVDTGDEDYEPACAEDDGSQDNEFQV